MAKFVIECPNCGKYAEAKTGFFARKKIDCACGYTIDVRTDKLSSRQCPHCGNNVVFDQSKGEKAKCPVCHEPINTMAEQDKTVEFSCAQCGIRLRTSKAAAEYVCPVCDCKNDVAERVMKEKIRHEGLASIIKYEGDGETLVWKHPIEDFNLGSVLIVHESQEALFFRDGQALDLFEKGRYMLETQQIPMLEKLYKLPADTEGTFHSEVYFINKTVQMAIKWGTPEKVRFIDPLTFTPLELGASGELNLQVSDSRRLLTKLVGTTKGIKWDDGEGMAKSLQASFRPIISNAVKVNLGAVIKENNIDILEIDEKLMMISERLREKLLPVFEEYGLTIPQLYVNHVVLPDENVDKSNPVAVRIAKDFENIRELHKVMLKTRMAQAEAAVKTAEEQSKAAVVAAHREVVKEAQTTATEVAKRVAERKAIEAQGEAAAARLMGMAEAEVMAAKGYNQKDVLQAEVQKAYAEGIGNMGPDTVSGGGGGSLMGDVLQMGMGLAAMNNVMPQMQNMFGGMQQTDRPNVPANGPMPGAPAPEGWTCPACGKTNIQSRFCPDCGTPKPAPKRADAWDCPACGCKGIVSRFCPDCGAKKPETPGTWTCPACGCSGITSNFCPECGAKKPEAPATWTCPDCGQANITTNFCPNCGRKKEN